MRLLTQMATAVTLAAPLTAQVPSIGMAVPAHFRDFAHERAGDYGVPDLETNLPPDGRHELRLWYGFGLYGIGFVRIWDARDGWHACTGPAEVIPLAEWLVTRELVVLGLTPTRRVDAAGSQPFMTGNGNIIIDCTLPAPPRDALSAELVLVGHADGRVDTLSRDHLELESR